MYNLSNLIIKLNNISKTIGSNISQLDYENLNIELDLMKNELNENISRLNIGNNTTKRLLTYPLDTQHFEWAMKNEKLLQTDTEWLNHWISNLKLCQDTADILSVYLKRYIQSIINFQKSSEFHTSFIQTTLTLFSGACIGLGIVIDDYMKILRKIRDNTDGKFQIQQIDNQEDKVSERITDLNKEIEKFLLYNPEKGILGMSAIRTYFESYIMIITRDKIRSHLRKKRNNNSIEIKFIDDFYHKGEIFSIIQTLFPEIQGKRVEKVLDIIYRVGSKSIHKGVPTPNYLIWTCWDFVSKELRSKFENLNEHSSPELERLISNLSQDRKICVTE